MKSIFLPTLSAESKGLGEKYDACHAKINRVVHGQTAAPPAEASILSLLWQQEPLLMPKTS